MPPPLPPQLPYPLMRDLFHDRNRASILLFETLWGLAMPLVYYSTLLPGYLRQLGIDNAWIGLAPALHAGTMAVVQPLSAYLIRPGARRLFQMRLAYAVGACGYALLGLAVLRGLASPTLALVATLLVVFGFAVAVGIGDPQYMEVVVAAIPAPLRGRFFGLRNVCLGFGGIAGGWLAGWLLRSWSAPVNFGACFLTGGALYVASTFSMALYREPPAPVAAPTAGLRRYLGERIFPHLRDRGFRGYLVAVVFFSLAASGFPFLALLLKVRLHEGDRLFGLLGGLLMAANLAMSWLLGAVCDRWGSRRGLALALLVYVAGVVGCLVLRDRLLLFFAYFLAAVWIPAQFVAMTDLALRLAARSPGRRGDRRDDGRHGARADPWPGPRRRRHRPLVLRSRPPPLRRLRPRRAGRVGAAGAGRRNHRWTPMNADEAGVKGPGFSPPRPARLQVERGAAHPFLPYPRPSVSIGGSPYSSSAPRLRRPARMKPSA